MDPDTAQYIRNNSVGILILTAVLMFLSWKHPDTAWRYTWIPLAIAFLGSVVVMVRYMHSR